MGLIDKLLGQPSKGKLSEILTLVRWIKLKQEIHMADTQQTLAKLAEANASLTGIRADIQALKDLIAAGGTPDEVAAAVDALAANLAATDSEQ